ncbi:MAG TPA: hypothetical protein VFI65_15955 [Streptosporangiaceae bacterium]|nr:hypothetical protein [Streptosporangiaceae bacterium]
MDVDPQRRRRQQPVDPPQDYQPSGSGALFGRQTSSPDVTHDLEWDPQIPDGDDPAPERPGAAAPLPPVEALGIDPGALNQIRKAMIVAARLIEVMITSERPLP